MGEIKEIKKVELSKERLVKNVCDDMSELLLYTEKEPWSLNRDEWHELIATCSKVEQKSRYLSGAQAKLYQNMVNIVMEYYEERSREILKKEAI